MIHFLTTICVIAEIDGYSFFLQFTTRDDFRGKGAIRTNSVVKGSPVHITDLEIKLHLYIIDLSCFAVLFPPLNIWRALKPANQPVENSGGSRDEY